MLSPDGRSKRKPLLKESTENVTMIGLGREILRRGE